MARGFSGIAAKPFNFCRNGSLLGAELGSFSIDMLKTLTTWVDEE
jgi:hypothetical protein